MAVQEIYILVVEALLDTTEKNNNEPKPYLRFAMQREVIKDVVQSHLCMHVHKAALVLRIQDTFLLYVFLKSNTEYFSSICYFKAGKYVKVVNNPITKVAIKMLKCKLTVQPIYGLYACILTSSAGNLRCAGAPVEYTPR